MQNLLDPSVGVGAGINLFGYLAGSRRWVQSFVLGFGTTKAVWRYLGARNKRNIQVPIAVSLAKKEQEE